MRTIASLFAAAGLAGLSAATCPPNGCLAAIQQNDIGLHDCNSFLLTTVYLPTPTVTVTPLSIDKETHTETISETLTHHRVVSVQPSGVIVSTYISHDVIKSTTHKTIDELASTVETLSTTYTTARRTKTTSTTETITTPVLQRRSIGSDPAASASAGVSGAVTVTPTNTPAYAATCHYLRRYSRNCISAGATTSTTTIEPSAPSSLVLSSTSVSVEPFETSIYVSTTVSVTSSLTLPSLHSTQTIVSSSTDVDSTSTAYSTTSTSTLTQFKTVAKVTLRTTTTTYTSTRDVPTPTPYYLQVIDENNPYSPQAQDYVITYYLDYVTQDDEPTRLASFPGGYAAIGFISAGSSANDNQFQLNADGYVQVLDSGNTYYLVLVPAGFGGNSVTYVVPEAAPAPGATLLQCYNNDINNCNYALGVYKYQAPKQRGQPSPDTIDVLRTVAQSSSNGALTLQFNVYNV